MRHSHFSMSWDTRRKNPLRMRRQGQTDFAAPPCAGPDPGRAEQDTQEKVLRLGWMNRLKVTQSCPSSVTSPVPMARAPSPASLGQLGRLCAVSAMELADNGLRGCQIQHEGCRCPWERQALLEDPCGMKGYPQFASDALAPSDSRH